MMKSCGIEFREYGLLPESQWETDIASLEAQITPQTRAILMNNPSNPCGKCQRIGLCSTALTDFRIGSVFGEEHLRKILDVAERHNLPILADEIYGDIVFDGKRSNVLYACPLRVVKIGNKFYPIASLTTTVPILSVGGISKEYLVPGLR